MTLFLKQSTAAVVSFGPFVDKTDGVTLEVGLVSALDHGTTGIFLSKNGGALTIRHATVTATTYDAYGCYLVTLDTTDTGTLGRLRMAFSEAATCLPVWQDFMVVTANIWDSLCSTDVLDTSVVQLLGTAWLTPGVAGTPDVNVKFISADATAADNAEAFFDGTGYAGTNNVIPTVTDVTNLHASAATAAALATLAGYVDTEVAAILEDTGTTLPATLATIAGYIDTEVAAILVDTGTTLDALIQDLPTNAELATALGTADDAVLAAIAALNNLSADDVLDEVVEGSTTMRQLLRLYAAILVGKASGGGTTTVVYRDLADSKDRLTMTVDADGNRSAVTRDAA